VCFEVVRSGSFTAADNVIGSVVSRCSSSESVSHRKRGRLVLLCVNDVFQNKRVSRRTTDTVLQ